MKPFYYRTFSTLALAILLLASCGSEDPAMHEEDSTDNIPSKIDTATQVIGQEEIKEYEIPEDEERKANMNAAVSVSPFANLGCCDSEPNYAKDCCCDEVIAKYTELVADEDTSIARLKMTDPILAKCRKKHQDTFDEIDNPEEDYDGLVSL